MNLIDEIKKNNSISSSQLIELFDHIADKGQVLILKSDGPRETKRFTCVISFPDSPEKSLRRDANTLIESVLLCISEYETS